MPNYSNAVPRSNWEKHGERPSVLDWGAKGDGVTDDLLSFQNAVDEIISRGGQELYLPGNRTYLLSDSLSIAGNIILSGDGRSTIVKRGGTVTTGKGLIDILGGPVILRNFLIEGDVTTTVGVNYSVFSGDPLHATLTANTSVWIHAGEVFIFDGIIWSHTGGYACIANASVTDIEHITFTNCELENCRPHLFGTSGGDLNYGSWTGGIMLHGNGTTASCKHIKVTGLKAKRCTGNVFWQHLYALTYLHEDINVLNCTGVDIGRDFIQYGGVIGGSCDNNYARRVGYVCTDDTTPCVPKFLNGGWGVGIDNSGLVIGVSITNNTLISCNGGYIDLDGFCRGIVTGNVCRTPSATDPEYAEDQINTTNWAARSAPGSPSWDYGAQTSNTSNAAGGEGVVIARNKFINLSGGAVNGYALRLGEVTNNNIEHPAASQRVPITLGNIGTGPNQRAYDNSVCGNTIYYSPILNAPAVFEDSSLGAFDPTDKNWVVGNKIIGTGYAFEFQKDAGTASSTRITLTTASVAVDQSETWIQREGATAGATYTRTFSSKANVQTSLSTLYDEATIHGSHVGTGPLMNLSAGAGTGGVFATGGRTTSAVDDSIVTGKVYADSFMGLAATTYDDAEADRFPATTALLRYDGTSLYYSTSVSAGARVWALLLGATAAAGSDTQVQYNVGGALAGSADFVYDYTLHVLTITGLTGTAGIVAVDSYIQGQEGFYTPSSSVTSIHSPNGGIEGNWLIGTVSLTLTGTTTATAGVSDATDIRLISNSADGYKPYISWGGNAFTALIGLATAAGADTQVQYNNGGALGASTHIIYNDTTHLLTVTGTTTTASITAVTSYIQSDEGFWSLSSAVTSIQSPTGGVSAKWLVGTTSLTLVGETEANAQLSSAGQARIICDSAHSYRAYISENGGLYVPLAGGGSSFGPSTAVQISDGIGGFTGTSNFIWDGNRVFALGAQGYIQLSPSSGTPGVTFIESNAASIFLIRTNAVGAALQLVGNAGVILTCGSFSALLGNTGAFIVGGASGIAGIVLNAGWIQSAQGFYTTSSSYQSVNIPSGGVFGRSIHASLYSQVGQSAGIPSVTTGNTMGNGSIYYDTSVNQLKALINSSWVAIGSGVTSVTGSGNITVSPTVGACIVSMINNPTFTSTVTAAGGLIVGSSGIISVGTLTCSGIVAGTNGVQCGGVNPKNGSSQYFGQNYKLTFPGGFTAYDSITGSLIGTFTQLWHVGGITVSVT